MNTAKIYRDSGNEECSIMQMVKREPAWAANRIQEGEKAIEKVAEAKRIFEELGDENTYRLQEKSPSLCAEMDDFINS